jgi:hypothetical protein
MSAESMDQIRFDFLGSVNGGNRSSNANQNAAEPNEAFAQILDQQLTRRVDSAPDRRSNGFRSRGDARDRSDEPRPQVLKRRDGKNATATATQDTASAKPTPKQKQPEKSASNDATGAKPAAKSPEDTEKPAEAAPEGQTTSQSAGSTQKIEKDGEKQTADQGAQQQNDASQQQQPGDDSAPTDTTGVDADLSLLALLAVPLPLQAITANADASAEATTPTAGGNTAAAALQANLAASLAGSIDLTAATAAKPQAPANAGGLKFGTILNAGMAADPKAATDAVAALQDAAEEIAKAADPLAQPAPSPNGTKLQESGTDQKAPLKTRDNGQTAAATVAPDLKSAAAAVQPMNREAQVTW